MNIKMSLASVVNDTVYSTAICEFKVWYILYLERVLNQDADVSIAHTQFNTIFE